MTTRRQNGSASVSKETKAVEKRRKVVLHALMSGLHSPEREGAKDEILHSYPQLRPLVTDMPPEDHSAPVLPAPDVESSQSGMTFASLFDGPKRAATPKLASLDVPAEAIYNTSVWSTSPIKRTGKPSSKKKAAAPFNPRWGDYDVMRGRWNYVRPYTTLLKEEAGIAIPSNATDRWVQLDTLPLPVYGNVADAMYLERRVGTPARNTDRWADTA